VLPAGIALSARAAPPVFGRGLLEAVPEDTILALADESDADGDGISGRRRQRSRPGFARRARTQASNSYA
jgi:CxxC motif-containing protein (DUF1111 family)